jgi:hypothetical protein
MFPEDAQTAIVNVSGTTSYVLLPAQNATRTILGVYISQENLASNTDIKCGDIEILTNFSKTTSMVLMRRKCPPNTEVVINKTGNDNSQTVLTYVNRDLITTPSSTLPAYVNGFSYGDIVSTVFLFLIFIIGLYSFLWFSLNRIKVDFKHK